MNYTGALNLKHQIQSRTLRVNHLDSDYVAIMLKMTKRLNIVTAQVIKRFAEDDNDPTSVVFYSMDDKTKINVGEPHLAVGFGGHGRRSIVLFDVTKIVGDYDFEVMSLTPSVILRVDISSNEWEDCTSYYQGTPPL